MRARLVVASHLSVGCGTGQWCWWTNERVVRRLLWERRRRRGPRQSTVVGELANTYTRTHTRIRTHTSTHVHTYTHKRARGAPPQRIAPPTHAQPANRSPRHDHVYHHPANQRLSRARPAVDLFSFLLYRIIYPGCSRPSDETCFPSTRL